MGLIGGISDKMSEISNNVQEGVKTSSISFLAFTIKLITGLLIGLTLSLIGQEMMNYGNLIFVFVLLMVTATVMKTIWTWNLGKVLIFDLICALIAVSLRMYILIAP
jgi:hypothetical protein